MRKMVTGHSSGRNARRAELRLVREKPSSTVKARPLGSPSWPSMPALEDRARWHEYGAFLAQSLNRLVQELDRVAVHAVGTIVQPDAA